MTTTTAVPIDTTSARLAPRAAARAFDGVLLGTTGMAVGTVTGFGYGWLACQLVLVAAYFVGLDAAQGATPGKRLLGLRVVAGNGYRRPTVTEAMQREAFVLLGAVPFAGPVLALVGWSAIAVTIRRGDAVHDRIAGTDVVVR